MMEEPTRKRSAFVMFLQAHGEKAMLGVVVAVGALFLILGWNGKYAEGEELKQTIEELLKGIDDPGPVESPPPVEYRRPRHAEPVPAVETPLWAGSLQTVLVAVAKPPPPVTVIRKILPRVAWGTAEPRPYAVTLSWAVTPYTKSEQATRKKKLRRYEKEEYPEVDTFLVERATAGSTDFERVGEVGGDVRSYVDGAVALKKSYVYRLTPRAAGRKVRKEDRLLMAVPVTVPGIWSFTFNGPNDGKGVYVEIKKIDRKHGPISVKKYQEVGSRLGWWPNRAGEDPTPDHYITREGEPLEVNLDTGVLLESVKRAKTSINILQCRAIVKPNVVLHENVTVRRPVTVYRIVLAEEGAQRVVHHPALQHRDERCKRHRGK